MASVIYGVLGIVWGSLYLALGLTIPATIPYGYVLLAAIVLSAFKATGRFAASRTVILISWLVLPLLLQLNLGGFVPGSAVVLWSLAAPIGALFFAQRQAALWGAGFLLTLLVAWILEPGLQPPDGLSDLSVRAFFGLNLGGVGVAVVFVLRDFLVRLREAREDLESEKERSENLLLNMLPAAIADRLKDGEKVIADRLEEVSVLFADLVGFTSMSRDLGAYQVVEALDSLVADFDRLAEEHGMEKIRTMGDAYMAVSGAPEPQPQHLHRAAKMALDMLNRAHDHKDPHGKPFELRIGIASGPVVAGVIGRRKFVYDVWGDTVNTASRMESQGLPGRIQVTQTVYEKLCDTFRFEERGILDIKGKGPMLTYLLIGPRDEAG